MVVKETKPGKGHRENTQGSLTREQRNQLKAFTAKRRAELGICIDCAFPLERCRCGEG